MHEAIAATLAAPVVEPDERDAREDARPPWAAIVTARRALVATRTDRDRELRTQLAVAQAASATAHRAFEAIVEREQRSSTARASKLHELRKVVELDLAGPLDAPDASRAAAEPAPETAIEITLEYLVAGARWAPSYVARLTSTARRAGFELRAVVAQGSGEDWSGVALRLSTAEPARFVRCCPSSRRNASAVAKMRRHAADFALRRRARATCTLTSIARSRRASGARRIARSPATAYAHTPANRLAVRERARDGSTRGGLGRRLARRGVGRGSRRDRRMRSISSRASATSTTTARCCTRWRRKRRAVVRCRAAKSAGILSRLGSVGGGMPPPASMPMAQAMAFGAPARVAPAPAPVAPPPRLDYGNLRMPPPTASDRGALVAAPPPLGLARQVASHVSTIAAEVDGLPLPRGFSADWAHAYDYAFAADGLVEVIADGAWHALPLTARPSTATVRHVAVPRERTDVYRVAAVANPLTGPLLPGPIDIYDRGTFLVTSHVDYTPPGAVVEIGLGVDAAVKVARNTEFREEAAGMLRGALKLVHGISIDIENLSGRAIELEVRERVPVVPDGDDDVELAIARVEPAWERWAPEPESPGESRLRGGYRWRVAVPAGGKRPLRAGYDVKISGKHELVGGNPEGVVSDAAEVHQR